MIDKDTLYTHLARYFSGQCLPSEKEEIDNWRKKESGNDALFLSLQEQWNRAEPDVSSFVIPDKTKVWTRIQTEISSRSRQIPLYTRALLIRAISVAAVVALVMGFSLSVFVHQEGIISAELQQTIVIAPSGQKTQLLLPDGTQVYLNSGSRLTYDTRYNTHDRTVTLEGEAFFDVTKSTEHPFIVKTEKVQVKVHGTAFNVSAYADEPDVSVSLLRGSVSILSASDDRLLTYLKPDESAVITKENVACKVLVCNAETDAVWRLNKLKFEGTPTAEVWKKLERWYGVQITLSNECPQNAYWFTLKTESLTELLEMMNRITPLAYQLNGEEVIIQYK